MTHDRRRLEDDRQPAEFRFRSCEGLADIDDLMRQLSDLLVIPVLCRKRACRLAERCRGGDGPPCLHQYPEIFAVHVGDRMREMRRFWQRQRALAAQRNARPVTASSPRAEGGGAGEPGASPSPGSER
jgi:hypothetical protein